MSTRKAALALLVTTMSILAAAGAATQQPSAAGATTATAQRMAEWNEWKFGLFVHWGPWSLTERGAIWDIGKFSPEEKQKAFELYKTFNPVKYDPAEWADVAKKAGMRYAVFVTKHHDGFCNWDTQQTEFKITNPECPYSKSPQPDLVAQYAKAFREAGLHVGLYYSHIDWHHPDAAWHSNNLHYVKGDFVTEQPERWKSFVTFQQEQVRELLTNYGPIDEFWFDISWPKAGLRDAIPMLKMMRELQPGIIIDNRGASEYGDFKTPEQYIPGAPPSTWWETCMTIANGRGFWYKGEKDATYKTPEELVKNLADIASKGGNFLLDTGPRPDGTIPEGEVASLLGMGKWMDVNGEAIYGTSASPWGSAPTWGRITRKGQRLYLLVFDWPKEGASLPLALASEKIAKATLLANGAPVSYRPARDGAGVELSLPPTPPGDYASVVTIDFTGALDVKPVWTGEPGRAKSASKKKTAAPQNTTPIAPAADGALVLGPDTAYTVGAALKYQPDRQNLGAWTNANDYAYWKINLSAAGKYQVEVTYGATSETNIFAIAVGDSSVAAKTVNTGNIKEYKPQNIGTLSLPAGPSQLSIKPIGELKGALMNLRSVKLTPAAGR